MTDSAYYNVTKFHNKVTRLRKQYDKACENVNKVRNKYKDAMEKPRGMGYSKNKDEAEYLRDMWQDANIIASTFK